ncbi:MAG: long-chain fatty acid--CoA ligase [Alphaproteobacteria bacterium]|nr:long-chain fatty acid--CoA ligase [Alphaproteobacteria bacterium]MDD9920203.1 long-chain fatty acid--CoA ligase [Alphaproteobacteria bacterium]
MTETKRWLDAYPPDVPIELAIKNRPAYQLFEDSAQSFPNRPCLNFLGKKQTYAEVQEQIDRFAAALQQQGFQKGERLGICLPNCPYFIVAYFGALKAGLTVVNFNPLYTEEELLFQAKDSGVSVMVTLNVQSVYPKVEALLEKTDIRQIIVCDLAEALPTFKGILLNLFKRSQLAKVAFDNRRVRFSDMLAEEKPVTPISIDPQKDIAVLQYTGGTTGVPKGAVLTHANVMANAEQVRLWLGETPPEGDKFLAVLPFFHVFAMTAVMNLGLITGSEIILIPRFDLKTVLKTIHKLRPTIFPGVPTLFAAINNDESVGRYNLSSIRYCISGGAALPEAVQKAFVERTGCALVEGYGLTESSPVAACNPCHTLGKVGSIGIPLPGTAIEIRDLDDVTKEVPLGERGEIVIKGPQVMLGYWQKPEETAHVLVDGWLRTGDVGYMDEDGYTFLTDRLKEIIITNGYNVYPRIIEEAFYKHPSVSEVVVIGIDDAHKGEVPKAFVTLKESEDAVTEQELLAFVKKHLNPIERPAVVEFRKTLPKTLIGKLSKKELLAEEATKAQNAHK